MVSIGSLGPAPLLNNYFLNPYLSGTFAFETYKPYDNLFLNSSLLTQQLVANKLQSGPLNDQLGRSILGENFYNSLFTGVAPSGFDAVAPSLGIGGANNTPNNSVVNLLVGILSAVLNKAGSTATSAETAEPINTDTATNVTAETPSDSGINVGHLLSALSKLGGFQTSAANSSDLPALFGSNPLPQFTSLTGGPFSNAPFQSPNASALATLDPVIQSSLFNEAVSPIFGNILANGGIPPFRSSFFGGMLIG